MRARALVRGIAAALSLASPALAQNVGLPGLTPHGAVSATDLLPIQAPTGSTLQSTPVSGLVPAIKSSVLQGVRLQQTTSTTYYVRTDGSDTACNGLTDAASSGAPNCAFASWQKAIQTAYLIDFNNLDVYIKAGSQTGVQTWNECDTIQGIWVGGARLHIDGNGANTVFNCATSEDFLLANVGNQVMFGSLELISGGGYGSLVVTDGSFLGFDNPGPIFGNAYGSHIFVHDNQSQAAILGSTYSIIGGTGVGNSNPGGTGHISVAEGGSLGHENNTVTITGTPSIAYFANATTNGTIKSTLDTFTGSINGARYYVSSGAQVSTLGAGDSYFPGSSSGTVTSGGQYVDDNQTTFANTWNTGFQYFGNNKHKFYDGGADYLDLALATSGTVNGYLGFYWAPTYGATFDGPGGKACLSAAKTVDLCVSNNQGIFTLEPITTDNNAAPTVSACGTSPSVGGGYNSGYFIVGTGTVTSCTITYPTSFGTGSWPTLTVGAPGYTGTYYVTSTATGFTVTFSTAADGVRFNFTANGG